MVWHSQFTTTQTRKFHVFSVPFIVLQCCGCFVPHARVVGSCFRQSHELQGKLFRSIHLSWHWYPSNHRRLNRFSSGTSHSRSLSPLRLSLFLVFWHSGIIITPRWPSHSIFNTMKFPFCSKPLVYFLSILRTCGKKTSYWSFASQTIRLEAVFREGVSSVPRKLDLTKTWWLKLQTIYVPDNFEWFERGGFIILCALSILIISDVKLTSTLHNYSRFP